MPSPTERILLFKSSNQLAKPNSAEGMLKFVFSYPKLTINKLLEVDFSVNFPRTNYDGKKSLAWDVTDIHHDTSLSFEAISRHRSYKNFLSPNF